MRIILEYSRKLIQFIFSMFCLSSCPRSPTVNIDNLQNTFRTPVYTTSKRRNAMGVGLVFEADLETREHINRWILQGVCLTLNDDE